jgi:hypothetical protein
VRFFVFPEVVPFLDAGDPHGCTDGEGPLLKADQRGEPRPDKEGSGRCDMGACESKRVIMVLSRADHAT